MMELGPRTEQDVVLAFLQAEIDSDAHGPRILDLLKQNSCARENLIDNADLNDARANNIRAHILGQYRGYGRDMALFEGFPSDTNWCRVLLGDVAQLKYVGHQQFWFDLTGGTRLVRDGVRNYQMSEISTKVDQLVDKVSNGSSFPDLVLVEDTKKSFVIIEGNHRATAFAIKRPEKVFALIGRSPAMSRWPFI
jgi:hypothetical protein